jgi:hypothetical protein
MIITNVVRNVPYNKWNNPYNKGTDNRCKNSSNGTNSLLGATFSNKYLPELVDDVMEVVDYKLGIFWGIIAEINEIYWEFMTTVSRPKSR